MHDDPELDLRVWIKPWGQIIEERRRSLNFIQKRLKIDPTRDDALALLRSKYREFIPQSIADESA